MYEAVAIESSPSSDTVVTIAETAERYGFDGVVVRDLQRDSSVLAEAADAVSIDVVDATTVTASDPHHASGAVGSRRSEATILLVDGTTAAMNRFAVETESVDVLANPFGGSGDVNHVIAKEAVENGVRIEYDLGAVLRKSGGERVRAIQSLRKLHEILAYYDAPYVVSASPGDEFQLRAPRELVAVGDQLGVPGEWIEDGLAEWRRLAARNRSIRSDRFIEPGVERGRYEADN